MRRSELVLSRKFLIGILIWIAVIVPRSESLRGSALILQAKTKLAESKQQTEEETNNGTSTSNTTITKPLLTGIPQIDYVHDPNLPRELNGQNLTDYPFYNAVPMPEQIDFKCDGLHDGFYASVPHKCQVYHHCLFGTRYDFLCANYTAFDQKTFICHFVSEVDCDNSPKYYKRNEALYKEATTTSTTTTTTSTPSTTTVNAQQAPNGGGTRHGSAGRRRRPFRRRRPMYEYYYDDEEYADSDYYDDEIASLNHRRNPTRKQNKDNYDENHDSEPDYDSHNEQVKPLVRPSNSGTSSSSTSIYQRPRVPPKIRRPVPKNERDKYDFIPKSVVTSTTTTTEKPQTTTSSKQKEQSTLAPEDDYYDEEEEYDYEEPKSVKTKHHMDYEFPTGFEETRRYVSRHRSRMPVRKRTDMYDDYDMKTRPRMNRRKEYNTRYESEYQRNGRPVMYRGNNKNRQEEPVQGHKKRVTDGEYRRRPEMKRPAIEYDYYYDDEEEEPLPKRNRRPLKAEKPKPSKTGQSKNERFIFKQPETTTKHQKLNNQRNAKANILEYETTKENEIPTTENASSRTTQKYKTIKIVNNSLKDESDEGVDYVSTEETKTYLTHTRPFVMVTKAIPKKTAEELQNKTVTQVRHFVITTPIRKPSHLGIFNATVKGSYTEEIPKLPEQKPQEYYTPAQYIKIPVTPPNQNLTTYQGLTFAKYFIPMEQTRNVKPVEEHLPENFNAISNGVNYNNAFIPEPKPFNMPKPQTYRQENRPYLGGERLFTNSITFPHQAPPNYDITAPGPSAPGEEPTAPEKKYSDLPNYTANADYDVTYNDALQPSTLQPVRRFPSPSFYVQSQPRRLPLEYAFNVSAFNTLNRSHKPVQIAQYI